MGSLRALADTSIFIALEQHRIASAPGPLAVSVVTIAELRLGVLSARDAPSRADRLRTLQRALSSEPFPVDDRVSDAWAEMTVALRGVGKRLTTNDSWIAATAIAHDLPLVTQDRDYDGVPGLDVVTL